MGTATFQRLAVLGLYAETTLHCGAESASGYVDLPVQRERHTGFPVIPGSTLKGVFKDEMRGALQGRLNHWFGEQDAAGQISFGDGVLAAFPVRSSGEPFHWVTSPLVLERVFRGMQFLPPAGLLDPPARHEAWGQSAGRVLVEELRLDKRVGGLFADEGAVAKLLSLLPNTAAFEYTRRIFPTRLLVVSDNDLRDLTETSTEIVTRIKLNILGTTTSVPNDQKGAVAEKLGIDIAKISAADLQGNLFVQEVVPSETLFMCVLRSNGEFPLDSLPKLVRIGGDETIGRGLTHVTRA